MKVVYACRRHHNPRVCKRRVSYFVFASSLVPPSTLATGASAGAAEDVVVKVLPNSLLSQWFDID